MEASDDGHVLQESIEGKEDDLVCKAFRGVGEVEAENDEAQKDTGEDENEHLANGECIGALGKAAIGFLLKSRSEPAYDPKVKPRKKKEEII